jgi:hypothetical protein
LNEESLIIWWTAFGAIAQAIGALATFAAVTVSLWVVISDRSIRARGSAGIRVSFVGDGSPGTYMVGIEVVNIGTRSFHVNSVGWRTGWLRRGPKVLAFQYAIQNTSVMLNQRPGPTIVEPGRDEGFYTFIADMKNSNTDKDSFFDRPLKLLGHAPIRAMINITGRKPHYIKVSDDLAEFLRTKAHANTTADN